MSADEFPTQLASTTSSSGSLQNFPLELVLVIVDMTLEDSRNGDSTAARRFSHVSRFLRAYTMPEIYKVLIIDVSSANPSFVDRSTRGPITGYDGREYQARPLRHLNWLLLDQAAEPRKYLKHIVFRHSGYFGASDIRPDMGWLNPKWEIDQLVVRYRMDAIVLHDAGIRAREVHHIASEEVLVLPEPEPLLSMASMSGHLRDYKDYTRGHLRCWASTQPAEEYSDTAPDTDEDTASESDGGSQQDSLSGEVEEESEPAQGSASPEISSENDDAGVKSSVRKLFGIVHRQLDPLGDHLDIELSDTTRRGQFIMIELHGDEVFASPDKFVDDIMAVLRHETRQTVVLVHDPQDFVATQHVAEIIVSAKRLLPTNARTRLRVSHASWDRKLLLQDSFRVYASLLQRGVDPWNDGDVPVELVEQ